MMAVLAGKMMLSNRILVISNYDRERVTVSDNKAEPKATAALKQLSEFEAGNGGVSDQVAGMMEALQQPNLEEELQLDCALDCRQQMEVDTSLLDDCEKPEAIVKNFGTFRKEIDETNMCCPAARPLLEGDPMPGRPSSSEHTHIDAKTSPPPHTHYGSPEFGDDSDSAGPVRNVGNSEHEHFEDDAKVREIEQSASDEPDEDTEAPRNERGSEGQQWDAEVGKPMRKASSALSIIPSSMAASPEAPRVLYIGEHAQSIAWTEGLDKRQIKDIKEVEVEHVYRQGRFEDTIQHQYLSSYRKLRTISLSSRLSKSAKGSGKRKRSASYDVWEMASSDEELAPPSSQRSVLISPSEQASKRVHFLEDDIVAHSRYVESGTQTDDPAATERDDKFHLVFHFPQKEKGQEIVFRIPVRSGAVLNVHAEQG